MENLSYQERLVIYQQSATAKPNLVRLFLKKESKSNSDKLNYELSKMKSLVSKPIIVNKEPEVSAKQVKGNASTMGFYRLNELHKDLHELARKQRDLYQKAVSLKLQLNDLHSDETVKALDFCIRIEDTFDEIDNIQKILKHYVDHKVVLLQIPEDFSHLTPAQVLQRRNNKRANRSKIKKKIGRIKEQLTTEVPLAKKTKLEVQLEKNQAKVLQLDSDIIALDKLVNGVNIVMGGDER